MSISALYEKEAEKSWKFEDLQTPLGSSHIITDFKRIYSTLVAKTLRDMNTMFSSIEPCKAFLETLIIFKILS